MKKLPAFIFWTFVGLALVTQGAPVISSISNSTQITQGSALTLSVEASGTAPLSYQWQKAGVDIPGATSSMLSFAAINLADTGRYTAKVTDSTGTASSTVLVEVNPASPPSISYGSSDVNFTIGQSFSIYQSVNGSGPFTYQWFFNGEAIPGATTNQYQVSYATAEHAGSYTLQVTNFVGSVTSNPVQVRAAVPTPLSITRQPSGVLVTAGQRAYFSLNYSGTSPFTFQLLRDNVVVQDLGSSLSWPNVTEADAGEYQIRITNATGTVTSSPFYLYVDPPLPLSVSISRSGSSVVVVGGSLNINSSVSSGSGLEYQWFKNGAPIPDSTGSSYSRSNVSLADAGVYHLRVTSSGKSIESNAIAVSISGGTQLLIRTHPASTNYRLGRSHYLSVSATGPGSFTYLWSKDGEPVLSSNSNSFSLQNRDPADVYGIYTVTVSNGIDTVTSFPATVSPLDPIAPRITSQPQGRTISQGNYFSVGVNYSGEPFPSVQWFRNGVAIPNATYSSYSVGSAMAADAGDYHAVVTNSAGSVTSATATVQVVGTESSLPIITRHPDSFTASAGQSISLQISLQGSSSGMTFQWFKDDVALPSATNSSLSLRGDPANDGQYHVVVSNSLGSVASDKATFAAALRSEQPPITRVSGGRSGLANSSFSLEVWQRSDLNNQRIIWRKDGVLIPAFTGTGFSNSISATTAGTYTAEITVDDQTYMSAPMRVTLIPSTPVQSPLITTEPASTTLLAGNDGSLTVYTSETSSYQWFKDDSLIPFATDRTLYLNNATSEYAGTYHVVVKSASGRTATSASASVTVIPPEPPVIIQHPASVTLIPNDSYLALNVSYESATSASFQWYRDGTPIPNSSNYYYSTSYAVPGDYHVVVSNQAGSVTSEVAHVAVQTSASLPIIIQQPTSVTSRAGGFVSFSVKGSGGPDLAYQWYHNNIPVSGANGSQLTLPSAQLSDAGTYTVTLINAGGAVSSQAATLTVVPDSLPVIHTQPTSRTIDPGASTTFSVVATAVPAPSYQWRRNGVDLFGAVNSSLSLTNVQAAQAGTYTVVVSNLAGSIISQPAVLSLTPVGSPAIGRHHANGNGYTPGTTVTITVQLSYSHDLASLGYQVLLPTGWSFLSSTATNTVSAPELNDTSLLEWAWADLPTSPMTFTFAVHVPAETSGLQEITALIEARRADQTYQSLANPDPLPIEPASPHHTADLNRDGKLGLSELLRVIELYNTRHQSTRTGRYMRGESTPDGFTADATQPASVAPNLSRFHQADTNRDGLLGLSELLRIIELYNTRTGTTRTGAYHTDRTTADGFSPGSGA